MYIHTYMHVYTHTCMSSGGARTDLHTITCIQYGILHIHTHTYIHTPLHAEHARSLHTIAYIHIRLVIMHIHTHFLFHTENEVQAELTRTLRANWPKKSALDSAALGTCIHVCRYVACHGPKKKCTWQCSSTWDAQTCM